MLTITCSAGYSYAKSVPSDKTDMGQQTNRLTKCRLELSTQLKMLLLFHINAENCSFKIPAVLPNRTQEAFMLTSKAAIQRVSPIFTAIRMGCSFRTVWSHRTWNFYQVIYSPGILAIKARRTIVTRRHPCWWLTLTLGNRYGNVY